MSLHFLLNDEEVRTDLGAGITVLDYLRGHRRLCGTKIGCREGDCGACTVLVGTWRDGDVHYRSMTSCLMPLGNAHGKHLVTIEGLNLPSALTPVQQAMCDEGASQCGFCTVGFMVSLAGHALDARPSTVARAVAAVDGNICRCTGYKSIERAAARISDRLRERDGRDRFGWLVTQGFLPAAWRDVPARMRTLHAACAAVTPSSGVILGGGTDLYVQRPEQMAESPVRLAFDDPELQSIRLDGDRCVVGAAATVTDLLESPVFAPLFPDFGAHMKLVSSTPIRNMATVGGNFVNASPIGDLTIVFLALDAEITLRGARGERRLPLRDFYRGYKSLDRTADEILTAVSFPAPGPRTRFHFEKVCKRTHLDIASVNTALRVDLADANSDGGAPVIVRAAVSAGGVAPVPLFLRAASEALRDRPVNAATVRAAAAAADGEIAPISDARGSAAYKRLLLRQLFYAHFFELFPSTVRWEELQ
jgi:xanthine dehydrogenase small subunit